MSINVTSVLVDDQAKALAFYTDVLGFVHKTEVPFGEHRWLTVVSPDEPDGVELCSSPTSTLPAAVQGGAGDDGIPFTSFAGGRRRRRVRAARARASLSYSHRPRWGR